MDLLTLDTMVVRDLWREDGTWRLEIEALLELATRGEVDLVVTRHLHDDIAGELARRVDEALDKLPITRTGGVFQLSASRLDRDVDRLADAGVVEVHLQLIREWLVGGPKPPGSKDWLHLHAHRLQGRDFLLTRDRAILRSASALARAGIFVMAPADYLTSRM